MALELHVRCLGRLSLSCREAPELAASELPLPATLKAQSLLAYLVVHRYRAHSRDHLAELFWGDRPEHNARRSLATALWQIRRCLPADDTILADSTDVQVNPRTGFWLDAAEFEKLARTRTPPAPVSTLQQAVESYGGAFLDGFYDDWVLSERYRLESLYCEALSGLMAAQEALGEHAAALAVAQRLLEQDPLREDAHRAIMRAYCRLGQRNAALAQYARCRQTLEAELGVPPMAETRALRQAILDGSLACATETAVAVPEAPQRRERARHPLDAAGQIPLVGRERELAFLADGWQAALAGQCHLLLISGEAGVGKTRLAQEFADQQRWQRVRVLQGRCYEFERLLPYQPVAEALRSLPPDAAATATAALPEWVAVQVGRLAPELMGTSPPAPLLPGEGRTPPPSLAGLLASRAAGKGAGGLGQDEAQERLFEAISRFLAQLAEQTPLLLILEDLHWAADSTLQLLHHLARSIVAQSFLIVGTLRSEAILPAHPLATLGRRLERDGLARRLWLSPLSAAAVAELIEQMSGQGEVAAPLAEHLHRETEGNPFYLIETVKALFEQGAIRVEAGKWRADYTALGRGRLPLPASVSETIAARVGRLSQATQDAVQVAAVAGREFDFDLLNGAWGKGDEATLAALDDLLRHRLITEAASGADYAFTHHKIQEVVYAGLPRHRRLRLHGQVGLALERGLGGAAGARAAELAHHFEQARQADGELTDKAIAYLLQASQQALRQSAGQEAIAYVRRGLAIVQALPKTAAHLRQEIDLQVALALPTTMVHGYGSPEARCVYEEARQLCQQRGDAQALFTTLVGLARNYAMAGDLATAVELGEQLVTSAEAARRAGWLVEACRVNGGVLFGQGRLQEARAVLERGLALYDPAYHERHAYRFGHDPAVAILNYLNLTLWLLGYPAQALTRVQQLETLAQAMVQPTSQVIAQCVLAKSACMRRDGEAALRFAGEGIRLSQAYGLSLWKGLATAFHGWALAERGEPDQGLAQLREGTAAWRATGNRHFTTFLLALQAEAALKAHELEAGRAALADGLAIASGGGDTYWLAELLRLRGELSWAAGEDGGTVEACFCEAQATARRQEAKMLELRAAVSLARLWRTQGRTQAAGETLAEIYGWFTEGFETPDLWAASALLAEM